jgi:hypothetical protein
MAHSGIPTAELQLEEILALAPLAHARTVGSELFVIGYQAAGVLLGVLGGSLLTSYIPLAFRWGDYLVPTWAPMQWLIVLCGITGWAFGATLAQSHHRTRFLAGIRLRATPDSMPASFAVEDRALRISTPRVEYAVAWDAVLEIIPSPAAWLLQVDLTTFQVPKRAFADEAQERAFVGKLLERVRPEVRERSIEAAAFAAAV